MNLKSVIFGSLCLIFTLGMNSCTNEVPIMSVVVEEVNLCATPKSVAYSGNYLLSFDVNGNLWYQNWDRPINVTQEEIEKVVAEFSKVREGVVNDIHIDWENYWVQQVFTGTQTYIDGYGNNIGTGSSHMNHLLAYNSNHTEWDGSHYEHINNFNSGSNNTIYTDDETHEQFIGTTLMTDMHADGVINQFGYHNSTDSKNHFEYIILEIDGYYYVGFDFYANGTEQYPANKNMDVERDWVFNDWIVRICPAYHKGETPTDGTDEPITPPTQDEAKEATKGEIEVNLSADDKNGEYLESHLSIHVRVATDVEIFIPIPMEYYCETDDMAIVQKHDKNLMVHGGPYQTTYTLQDEEKGSLTVTLNVDFLDNGIKIWTDGINQDVIDFCYKHYDDGITFEVWNYFNEILSKEGLLYYLNQATIEFLDKIPNAYINAFNEIDGNKNEDDCTVSIVNKQVNEFNNAFVGEHYNGSKYNEIYEKK